MERIVNGYRQFQSTVFPKQKDFFERLAGKQQNPVAVFITCSDSRIDPNLITQTEPGDLFILRNAGNIIPPAGCGAGGEAAAIEYALGVLGIEHIILCGHAHCGAMQGLMQSPGSLTDLPAVCSWFSHAEATRRIVKERYADLQGDELIRAVVEENVLVQINNLSTHPFVAARLSRGALKLYGWVYEIETGKIFEYDQGAGKFMPLSDSPLAAAPLPVRQGPFTGRQLTRDSKVRVVG